MSNFRQFDRATGFLLPPSLDEWLAEQHLARFVVEVIDGLDLSAMVKSYRGSGSASYHPALLLGLLVYGYTTGVFSSRKLAPFFIGLKCRPLNGRLDWLDALPHVNADDEDFSDLPRPG